jgi:hypothetical protein
MDSQTVLGPMHSHTTSETPENPGRLPFSAVAYYGPGPIRTRNMTRDPVSFGALMFDHSIGLLYQCRQVTLHSHVLGKQSGMSAI